MVDNKQKLIITNKNTSTIITTNTTEITTTKPFPLFQWQYLLKEWKNILGTEYELTIYSFAEKFQYLFGLCYDCKEIHYAIWFIKCHYAIMWVRLWCGIPSAGTTLMWNTATFP